MYLRTQAARFSNSQQSMNSCYFFYHPSAELELRSPTSHSQEARQLWVAVPVRRRPSPPEAREEGREEALAINSEGAEALGPGAGNPSSRDTSRWLDAAWIDAAWCLAVTTSCRWARLGT
jgi:hypothetical protein